MKNTYAKLLAQQIVESKLSEGPSSSSGINRSAPASDVSYEKVLNDVTDKWRGQTVAVKEMGVDKLRDYADKAKQVNPATTPKFKMVKHAEGHAKANQRIAQKTGDRRQTYESRLQEYINKLVD